MWILLHLGLSHYSTSSQLSYSCGTRSPVGNETMLYRAARHLLPSVKHVLLHICQHRLDPCNDGRLLCQYHCYSHISNPFWPVEDVVQNVPFTNEEDDNTGQDYLCPRTQTPVSPIVTRPSTLNPLDIPRQVVVLPPLLTRKVETLSLFCDVWRRRRCNEWVCNVLEVGFRLRLRECPPMTGAPCVCRQGLYREAHSPPVTDTVHATKQRCRGSLRHYISRVLQSPLPRDSPLHDGE